MFQFIRQHSTLLALIVTWVMVAAHAGILLYGVLPITVLLLHRREMWQDILFGFIICLVFSDMSTDIHQMVIMKSVKNTYILTLLLIFIADRSKMVPLARIFPIFLPFLLYSYFPIIDSPDPFFSFQKTLSYSILYLVVPNMVLLCFRRYGWNFFRNLIWFTVLILITQRLLPLIGPSSWVYLEDRFRGYFGNPNGLAIFCYLTFMLFVVLNHLRPDMFSTVAKVLIYAILVYYLIICGSRTSLMSTLMFVVFIRFFRISPFLGLISFVAFIGIGELISSNLVAIVTAMGLQDYMRVDTIADGSGRYIAWNFAWKQLNEGGFFLFGGGFVNDELIMARNSHYLSTLGHQGGVHNTYLTLWLNVGIVGILIFLRSFILVFLKAGKQTPIAFAVMFSVLFSILYESWLAGSLNPYTIMLLIILTIVSEDEIMNSGNSDGPEEVIQEDPEPALLILPAR